MKAFNDFCWYCTGGCAPEIRGCTDRDCPFYPFRYGGLEPEVEKEICQKILISTGAIQDETKKLS